MFDSHPTRHAQNIKYSSIVLCNAVNIINCVDDAKTFLDELAGEYYDKRGDFHEAEDKNQAYRRIPFIISMHENYYEIRLNKGFANGTEAYQEYIKHPEVNCNMREIADKCAGASNQISLAIQAKAVEPIIKLYKELMQNIHKPAGTEEELLEQFRDVGKGLEISRENYEQFLKVIEIHNEQCQDRAGKIIPLTFDGFIKWAKTPSKEYESYPEPDEYPPDEVMAMEMMEHPDDIVMNENEVDDVSE